MMKDSHSRNDERRRADDLWAEPEEIKERKVIPFNRRQVRDWTRAWANHMGDYVEHDEFYGK